MFRLKVSFVEVCLICELCSKLCSSNFAKLFCELGLENGIFFQELVVKCSCYTCLLCPFLHV